MVYIYLTSRQEDTARSRLFERVYQRVLKSIPDDTKRYGYFADQGKIDILDGLKHLDSMLVEMEKKGKTEHEIRNADIKSLVDKIPMEKSIALQVSSK
jgi:hypothetical protein